MDETDRQILSILRKNARATLRDIAAAVALSAPAAAQRIKKLEQTGVITGYTVLLNLYQGQPPVDAFISITVPPAQRVEFSALVTSQPAVQACYQVTGSHSHMVQVRCRDIPALNTLLNKLQKLGSTNTQIVLSTLAEGAGQ